MRKLITAVFCLCLMLAFSLSAFADKAVAKDIIEDFSGYTDSTIYSADGSGDVLFYAAGSTATKVAVENGKAKLTIKGVSNQYLHMYVNAEKSKLADPTKADGLRWYVKTGDESIGVTIRVDFWGSDSKGYAMFGSNGMYLTDVNGKEVDYEFLTPYQIIIPADFEGYVNFPFEEDLYQDLAGGALPEPSLANGDWTKYNFHNIVFFFVAVDDVEFTSALLYVDDMQTYKNEKTADSTTKAPANTDTPSENPTTGAPLLIGAAVSALAAAAYVVRRKK